MGRLYNGRSEVRIYSAGLRIDISGLHHVFAVEASRDAAPNRATVQIYNLDPELRGLIDADHQAVEILVASNSQDPLTTIFMGEIDNATREPPGLDDVQVIYAGEGLKAFTSRPFRRSYAAGAVVQDILRDVAAAVSLPLTLDGMQLSSKIARARTYDARATDVLNEIAKEYDLTWSVQQGVIEILDKYFPIRWDGAQAVVLSPDTGIIEYPVLEDAQELTELVQEKSKKKAPPAKGDEKKRVGVWTKTLFIPGLTPGGLINIRDVVSVNRLSGQLEGYVEDPNVLGVWAIDRLYYTGESGTKTYEVEVYGSR